MIDDWSLGAKLSLIGLERLYGNFNHSLLHLSSGFPAGF